VKADGTAVPKIKVTNRGEVSGWCGRKTTKGLEDVAVGLHVAVNIGQETVGYTFDAKND
jgi:hypothetical protein